MFSFVLLFTSIAASAAVNTKDIANCSLNQVFRLNSESKFSADSILSNTRAAYFPGLSASGTVEKTRTSNDAPVAGTDVGKRGYTLTVSQKILSAATLAAWSAAKSGVNAAEQQLAQSGLDLAFSALSDLVALQQQYEQFALTTKQKESYELMTKVLSVTGKLGLSDSSDLLQAKSAAISDSTSAKQIEFTIQQLTNAFTIKYGYKPVPLNKINSYAANPSFQLKELPIMKAYEALSEQAIQTRKQKYFALLPELAVQADFSKTF